MTWYANEILCEAKPSVLEAIAGDDRLRSWAYHLTDPLEHEWHDKSQQHGLPPAGLVVIRPVSGEGCDGADWFGEYLSWNQFDADVRLPASVTPNEIATRHDIKVSDIPPVGFLRFLSELQSRTDSTVVYYQCSTWAGNIELECAWIFESEPCVLLRLPVYPETPVRNVLIEKHTVDEIVVEQKNHLLGCVLDYLDIRLPSIYFAPHEREFPWKRYQIEF